MTRPAGASYHRTTLYLRSDLKPARTSVRSRISGTQRGALMRFPVKNREMSIQAIDIHEFKDGKIVRTWHTEDWTSGLHQLGVFDK